MSDNGIQKIKDRFSQAQRLRWIVIVGLVGVALIAASALWEREAPSESVVREDIDAYIERMEERLEEMVSSIRGAGHAQVMITLNNGVEYVYANEEKTNSDHTQSDSQVSVRDDNQTTIVTVDDTGLLVTEIQPIVRGVVVACEGAGDEAVVAMVNQAVRTALDIAEKRVCVMPYDDR